MNAFEQIRKLAPAGGVLRWLAPLNAHELSRQAQSSGWRSFYLDGRSARNKRSFLQTAADAMSFPSYFGHNWDAFEECINDLAWTPAPGYVLLYDHVWWLACAHQEDWQIARSILQTTCQQWATRNTPFIVLLRHTHGCSGVSAAIR